jgi:hypothetical protein
VRAASIDAGIRREATGLAGTCAAGRSAAPSTSHPGQLATRSPGSNAHGEPPAGPVAPVRCWAGSAGQNAVPASDPLPVGPAAWVASTPSSPAMLVLTLEAWEYVRWTGNGHVALRRSAKEHVAIEHAIPRWTCSGGQGFYSQQGDHSSSSAWGTGAVDDLLAVAHRHPKPHEHEMTSTVSVKQGPPMVKPGYCGPDARPRPARPAASTALMRV